jgi:hypothetical protein
MFCGCLLHQFFGGSANYVRLVNPSKGKVAFDGGELAQSGESARNISFYGQQEYGHVKVLIGERTGHVYRIEYDSEPLVGMMSNPEGDVKEGSSKTIIPHSIRPYQKGLP